MQLGAGARRLSPGSVLGMVESDGEVGRASGRGGPGSAAWSPCLVVFGGWSLWEILWLTRGWWRACCVVNVLIIWGCGGLVGVGFGGFSEWGRRAAVCVAGRLRCLLW